MKKFIVVIIFIAIFIIIVTSIFFFNMTLCKSAPQHIVMEIIERCTFIHAIIIQVIRFNLITSKKYDFASELM